MRECISRRISRTSSCSTRSSLSSGRRHARTAARRRPKTRSTTDPCSAMRSDYIKPYVLPSSETRPSQRFVRAGGQAVLADVERETETPVEGVHAGLAVLLVDVARNDRERTVEAAQRIVRVEQDHRHRLTTQPLDR